MKKVKFTLLLPVAALLISITGCKKEEDTPTQTQTVSSTEMFNYSDAWGLLAAVNTVTTQTVPFVGEVEVELGTAVTAFNVSEGSNTYQEAGTVTCEGEALTKQSNNSYIFQPSNTDPEGLEFTSGASWNVSGSTNVGAFSYTYNGFPSNPKITSNTDEVTLANGYTCTITSVSGADSILIILASGNGYVEKRIGGNATSASFSAADLSTLTASDYGLIQVTPYKIKRDVNVPGNVGKAIYFVNQVTVSDIAKFK